jgi:hypothetical protein
MIFLKRTLPLVIAFVVGVVAFALYFIPHQAAQDATELMARWSWIILGFAFFLGMYSLLRMHGTRIRQRQGGWAYSLVTYFGFGIMMIAVFYNNGEWMLTAQVRGGLYDWLFYNVQVPSESTMFSLLAFFIASAAYRTFRARTTEAVILLIAAIFVMLGRVPIGALVWDQFPALQEWIMSVPNLAAKRGILLGVYLGMVATALKIIFGIERSYLGGGGDE